jgi:hypothetical protein
MQYKTGEYKSLQGIHWKIEQILGMPNYCEHCNRSDKKVYDWANKDHKYSLDTKDWIRLCRSCHMKMDFKIGHRKTQLGNINAETKKVWKISLDGEYLCRYSSIAEASRLNLINRIGIVNMLKGRSKTSGGFLWKY